MSINATAANPVITPPEKQERMKELTSVPKVAWPTYLPGRDDGRQDRKKKNLPGLV